MPSKRFAAAAAGEGRQRIVTGGPPAPLLVEIVGNGGGSGGSGSAGEAGSSGEKRLHGCGLIIFEWGRKKKASCWVILYFE